MNRGADMSHGPAIKFHAMKKFHTYLLQRKVPVLYLFSFFNLFVLYSLQSIYLPRRI